MLGWGVIGYGEGMEWDSARGGLDDIAMRYASILLPYCTYMNNTSSLASFNYETHARS
jgi:hypothetical protein